MINKGKQHPSYVIVIFTVLLTGCGGTYAVSANPLFVTPDEVVAAMAPQNIVGEPKVVSSLASTLNGTTEQKKQFIGALLLDSETKCNKFINNLTATQNGVNATGDVLATILSGVATAVAPIGVSHGFSAASAIVSGSKTALSQDFWANAGVQDFQKALATSYYLSMKSYTDQLTNQDNINLPIEIEKIQSVHSLCSVSSAMSTISTTLSSATQQISNLPGAITGSGVNTQIARSPTAATPSTGTSVAIPGLSIQSYVAESQIRHSAFTAPTQTTDLILHWLWPSYASRGAHGLPLDSNGKPAVADPNHLSALRDWLNRNPVDGQVVPVFIFVNSSILANLRERAVLELPITGNSN